LESAKSGRKSVFIYPQQLSSPKCFKEHDVIADSLQHLVTAFSFL